LAAAISASGESFVTTFAAGRTAALVATVEADFDAAGFAATTAGFAGDVADALGEVALRTTFFDDLVDFVVGAPAPANPMANASAKKASRE